MMPTWLEYKVETIRASLNAMPTTNCDVINLTHVLWVALMNADDGTRIMLLFYPVVSDSIPLPVASPLMICKEL
jgi:hypothetical protein